MSTIGTSQPSAVIYNSIEDCTELQLIREFTKCDKSAAIPQETAKTFAKTESIFAKIKALFLKPSPPSEFEKAHSEFYIPKSSPVNDSNFKKTISSFFERLAGFFKAAIQPKQKAPVIIIGRQLVRVDYKIVNNNRTDWCWFVAEEPIYGYQK